MSVVGNIREDLSTFFRWGWQAPRAELFAIERTAGRAFPFDVEKHALCGNTPDALRTAIEAAEAWVAAAIARGGPELASRFPAESVKDARHLFEILIPEYEACGDGSVRTVLPDCPNPTGTPRYHTLVAAGLAGAFNGSAFSRPIRAVPLYDAEVALSRAGGRVDGLTPTAYAAAYRVEYHDGVTRHPPCHPSALSTPIQI